MGHGNSGLSMYALAYEPTNLKAYYYHNPLQLATIRGVVEAIRAHTAYGYLFYLLESVWVVIEDATMQLYGAVWPSCF